LKCGGKDQVKKTTVDEKENGGARGIKKRNLVFKT